VENAGKGRRFATALGFLSGVIACLDALRDVHTYWPPDTVWEALTHAKCVELAGGLMLMAVSLIVSIRTAMTRQ